MNVQTVGSMIVIATFIAAEASTVLLAARPASPLAWYLNLELFGVFERARAEPSPLRFLFGSASLAAGLTLLLLVGLVRLARWRLGVAIAANLSFCFAVALALAAAGSASEQTTASLFSIPFRPDSSAVAGVLLLASFAAAAMSHATYILAIFRRKLARAS